MTFYVQKEWEEEIPFPFSIDMADIRKFPAVKTALAGTDLFFVDVQIGNEEFEQIERFIFGDIWSVLSSIEDIGKARVSLLSRRLNDDDGGYSIFEIIEILRGDSASGGVAHVYVFKGGNRHCDSGIGEAEGDLSDLKTIYFKRL